MTASRNLGLAIAAAHEYAETASRYGSNHARCIQLRDQIDFFVGKRVDGKWVLPDVVRKAMAVRS
jgi:hypothetical protein